jgi:regulator of sigma E protease
MMYILSNIQWFFLLLGLLILVHEGGHYLVAKACGVEVERFSLGFGPVLLKWHFKGTLFMISLIPLGGYIKMRGDEGDAFSLPSGAQDPKSFAGKPLWQRSAIVAAGPLFNFLFAIFIYWILLSGYHAEGMARLGLVEVDSPAWQAGLRPGDEIQNIEDTPIHNWEALRREIGQAAGRRVHVTYLREGKRQTTEIIPNTAKMPNEFNQLLPQGRIGVSLQYLKPIIYIVDSNSPAAQAGLASNDEIVQVEHRLVFSWHELREELQRIPEDKHTIALTVQRQGQVLEKVLDLNTGGSIDLPASFTSADASGGRYTGLVNKDPIVLHVDPNTPADKAGLRPGDRLLAADYEAAAGNLTHRAIQSWRLDLSQVGSEARNGTCYITYQRGRDVMKSEIVIPPEHIDKRDLFQAQGQRRFGATHDPNIVQMYQHQVYWSPWYALAAATQHVAQDSLLILSGLKYTLQNFSSQNQDLGGPMMLFVVAEQSAKYSWSFFFSNMGMFSINLGVFNLLPIPVLDGGYLLFFACEAILRRPLSLKSRYIAQIIGLTLLVSLMFLSMSNDIRRFIWDV